MTVEAVDTDQIRFILSHQEISTLFGDYEHIDYQNRRTKYVLNKLLTAAKPHIPFPLDSRQLLIEVKPCIDGCIINLKKQSAPKSEITWFQFQNADNLADACCQLAREPLPAFQTAKLYRTAEKDWLLSIGGVLSERAMTVLSEYSEPYTKQNSIKTSVCTENTIERIARAFAKKKAYKLINDFDTAAGSSAENT